MPTDPIQLKYPVVLVHGLGARSTYGPVEYFFGLPSLLKKSRNKVLVANLTAWHTIEYRAKQLKTQIERAFPEGKVNLVGHSMGGLDARLLASQMEFSERIASITTIGTPNHGTTLGDIAVGLIPNLTALAVERFLSAMSSSSGALKQITREYCTGELQRLAPKMPGIGYFSAATSIPRPIMKYSLPIFWLPHNLLNSTEGDNDGFVSVESAKWGDHICTYHGDHYAQIGQFLGRSRGMDYLKFYHEIFSHLKKSGM